MKTGEAMNATQKIKITGKEHEETGWKRYIYLEHKGEECELTLFWDEFNGYEIYWRVPNKIPKWAIEWNEDSKNEISLAHYLDDLTYETEVK